MSIRIRTSMIGYADRTRLCRLPRDRTNDKAHIGDPAESSRTDDKIPVATPQPYLISIQCRFAQISSACPLPAASTRLFLLALSITATSSIVTSSGCSQRLHSHTSTASAQAQHGENRSDCWQRVLWRETSMDSCQRAAINSNRYLNVHALSKHITYGMTSHAIGQGHFDGVIRSYR
jgi:hypothetical protein